MASVYVLVMELGRGCCPRGSFHLTLACRQDSMSAPRSQRPSFAMGWGWLLYDLVVAALSCRCRLLFCFASIVRGSTCLLPLVRALSSQRLVSVIVKSSAFWMVGPGTHSHILPPDLKAQLPGGQSSQSIPAYSQALIKVPQ